MFKPPQVHPRTSQNNKICVCACFLKNILKKTTDQYLMNAVANIHHRILPN